MQSVNIIVICPDTLRCDALGCYNPTWVQMPAIDRYAHRALRFTEVRCASFPTVPMRADAYTGDVNWPRYGRKGPDPSQPILPLLLRGAGYRTGLVLDTENNVRAGFDAYYDECHLIEKPVDDGVTRERIAYPVLRENLRQNGWGYAYDRARWSHYRDENDWFAARTIRRAYELWRFPFAIEVAGLLRSNGQHRLAVEVVKQQAPWPVHGRSEGSAGIWKSVEIQVERNQ